MNRKPFFTGSLIAVVLFSLYAYAPARQVEKSEVAKAAANFIQNEQHRILETAKAVEDSTRLSSASLMSLSRIEPLVNENGDTVAYVAELSPEGYLVVSTDTRLPPIISYSEHGEFPWDEDSPSIFRKMLLYDLNGRLQRIDETCLEHKTQNEERWIRSLSQGHEAYVASTTTTRGPLIKTEWGQDWPYYEQCPYDPVILNARCYVGCTAIMKAQTLYYWNYPKSLHFRRGILEDSYTSIVADINPLKFRIIDIDGDHEKLSFPSFDLLNERLSKIYYDGSDSEIGYLCFGVGIKTRTGYSSNFSGAAMSPAVYLNDFGYASARRIYPIGDSFYKTIRQNIIDERPVNLSIRDFPRAGHAVIVDGYQENDDLYHINFGWGNEKNSNTWYNLPHIGVVDDYDFSVTIVDSAIVDIDPHSLPMINFDGRNTRRAFYRGPEENKDKWNVDGLNDGNYQLSSMITGSGGNLYVFCSSTGHWSNPGKMVEICPFGTIRRTVQIPAPARSMTWPAQALNVPRAPIFFASGSNVYRILRDREPDLLHSYPDESEYRFTFPTMVDEEGNVYLVSERKVCSLTPTGEQRWEWTTNSSSQWISAGIAIDDKLKRIYVKYADTTNKSVNLQCLNAEAGTTVWTKSKSESNLSSTHGGGEPTIANDGVVYCRKFNSIIAFNPDGSEKWVYSVDPSNEFIGSGFISLGRNDRLYIGGWNHSASPRYAWLRALHAENGIRFRQHKADFIDPSGNVGCFFQAPVVYSQNNVIVTCFMESSSPGYRKIYAYDEIYGEEIWSLEGPSGVIPSTTGATYAIDYANGRITAIADGDRGNPYLAAMGFTNNRPPDKPTYIHPDQGAFVNSDDGVTFGWSCSDPDGHDLKYDLYIGSGELLLLYASGIENTQLLVEDLEPGTPYAWKIVATDGQDITEGDTWIFVTEATEVPHHSADTNQNWKIEAGEISRVVAFYNAGEYHIDDSTPDGFAPGAGNRSGSPHSSDYNPQDWRINAAELSRLVTFYNAGGYRQDSSTPDGFAPGLAPTTLEMEEVNNAMEQTALEKVNLVKSSSVDRMRKLTVNQTTTISVSRSVPNGQYPSTGGTVDVSVTFARQGTASLLSLMLQETLPSGWTFDSIVGTAPGVFLIQPSAGASGTLDFVWMTPPTSFPATMTYRVNVPSGQSGTKTITGSGTYNAGTPADQSFGPVATDLNPPPDPTPPPTDTPTPTPTPTATPTPISEMAYSFSWKSGCVGNEDGHFGSDQGPRGLVVVGDSVYVCDYSGNRLQWFDKSSGAFVGKAAMGTYVTDVDFDSSRDRFYIRSYNKVLAYNSDFSTKYWESSISTSYWVHYGLCVDSKGYIHTPSAYHPYVYILDTDGSSYGQYDVPGPDGGLIGIESDAEYIYLSTVQGVKKYREDGSLVGTVLSDEIGVAHIAAFHDNSGFVATRPGSHEVIVFDSLWVEQSRFGQQGSGDGQFKAFQGVAVDSDKNIYVSDGGTISHGGNYRIQKFSLALPQDDLTLSRSVPNGQYPSTGGTVDVSVTFARQGTASLLSLMLQETLPSGWTFDSIVGTAPGVFLIQPSAGASGTLDFVWMTPPTSFPATMTYRVNVPSGQSGTKTITGSGTYNAGTPADQTFGPVATNLLSMLFQDYVINQILARWLLPPHDMDTNGDGVIDIADLINFILHEEL